MVRLYNRLHIAVRRWGLVVVTLFVLTILYRRRGGQVIVSKADLWNSGEQGQSLSLIHI